MTSNNPKQIIDENNGIMIRVDKTLNELMDEKPSSRWDPNYWHPIYEKMFKVVKDFGIEVEPLNNYINFVTSGYRGRLKFVHNGFCAVKVRNVLETGLDLVNIDYLAESSPAVSQNKRLQNKDIILNRSGTGSIGRMTVFIDDLRPTYITGDVYRLGAKLISPFFLVIVLNTFFCKKQIHRFETGVSGQTKIDLEEVLNIQIPKLKEEVQNNIEKEYLKMHKFHEKAMEAKKENNENEYRENIKIAEERLNDLIKKTEQVIRGERKDVV